MSSLIKDAAALAVAMFLAIMPIALVGYYSTALWGVVLFVPALFVSCLVMLGFRGYLDCQEVSR